MAAPTWARAKGLGLGLGLDRIQRVCVRTYRSALRFLGIPRKRRFLKSADNYIHVVFSKIQARARKPYLYSHILIRLVVILHEIPALRQGLRAGRLFISRLHVYFTRVQGTRLGMSGHVGDLSALQEERLAQVR